MVNPSFPPLTVVLF